MLMLILFNLMFTKSVGHYTKHPCASDALGNITNLLPSPTMKEF